MPRRRGKKDNMKRVLFITPRKPWPLYGMTIRWMNHAKWLSEKYTVDLLCLDTKKITPKEKKELLKTFSRIIDFTAPKTNTWKESALALMTGEALQYRYFYYTPMHEWLKKHAKEYDLLFFNTVRTMKYSEGIKHDRKVIDLTDAISLNYEKAREYAGALWKLLYWIDSRRLLKHEVNATKDFESCFITTERDKDWIVKHGGKKEKIHVLTNPVKECRKKAKEEDWVTFVGKMDYAPNEDAVIWFARRIFPLIKKKKHGIKFYVVGMNPTKKIKSLASEDIIVTGRVPEVQSYYLRSKVVVAPLRFGAGVQNKVIEAMACGSAVVLTSQAAEGINAINGRDYLIADTEEEFAEKVLSLLDDDKKREDIEENARKFAKKKHDPKKLKQILLKNLF